MRTFLFAVLLVLAPWAIARDVPLPSDSVYQLQARLVDQEGQRSTWSALRGKPRVVAMFYTSCPYVCPMVIDSGKAVERQLTAAQRQRLGIVLVSIDPKRDTPARLKQVMRERKLDAHRWTLVSPSDADLRALAGLLDVRYRQLADGQLNHTSAWVLLDADGRVLARTEKIGGPVEPEFMAAVRRATTR